MTRTEIASTGTTILQQRLAVVDYSTIRECEIEASNIRAELYRRKHQPTLAQTQYRRWLDTFAQ